MMQRWLQQDWTGVVVIDHWDCWRIPYAELFLHEYRITDRCAGWQWGAGLPSVRWGHPEHREREAGEGQRAWGVREDHQHLLGEPSEAPWEEP